jgi:hypothetical protein
MADLDQFLEKFSRTFGKRDRALIATTKLQTLQQRSRLVSAYIVEFQQLACDLDWNDTALITMFRWGLRDDIKTLLLNLRKPTTLSEAITQAIDCNNRLFEQQRERQCSLDHIGHFGYNKTMELISRDFWWPQMWKTVKDYVTTCDTCSRSKIPRH